MTKTLVVVITYEPTFEREGGESLLEFYRANFDSLRKTDGAGPVVFCISDFASSNDFKTFLRSYVQGTPQSYVIDGEQETSGHMAFNTAMRLFPSEHVVYAASDIRARDPQWLSTLLADCQDPRTAMVQTTVTFDGYYFQTQPAPLSQASRRLAFPEALNLHCVLFRKAFFEPFDGRYPDIFGGNYTEYCLLYLLGAQDAHGYLNFRVNMIHNRFHEGLRHNRTHATSWRVREGIGAKDDRTFQIRRFFLPIGNSFSRPVGPIRWLRKHLLWTRREGWQVWLFKFLQRPAYQNFLKLDRDARITMAKALFYRPLSDYAANRYRLWGASGEVSVPEPAPLKTTARVS